MITDSIYTKEYRKMSSQEKLDYYRDTLKEKGGLTSDAWHIFDVLEKRHDPESYKKRKEEQHRNYLMDYARRLSIEDLKLIIKEKEASNGYSL